MPSYWLFTAKLIWKCTVKCPFVVHMCTGVSYIGTDFICDSISCYHSHIAAFRFRSLYFIFRLLFYPDLSESYFWNLFQNMWNIHRKYLLKISFPSPFLWVVIRTKMVAFLLRVYFTRDSERSKKNESKSQKEKKKNEYLVSRKHFRDSCHQRTIFYSTKTFIQIRPYNLYVK